MESPRLLVDNLIHEYRSHGFRSVSERAHATYYVKIGARVHAVNTGPVNFSLCELGIASLSKEATMRKARTLSHQPMSLVRRVPSGTVSLPRSFFGIIGAPMI